jgi:hypothetical protein
MRLNYFLDDCHFGYITISLKETLLQQQPLIAVLRSNIIQDIREAFFYFFPFYRVLLFNVLRRAALSGPKATSNSAQWGDI